VIPQRSIPALESATRAGCEPAHFSDAERERLIEAYRVCLELEPNQAMKRIAWGRMAALIGDRSPEQIAKMEIAKGLR
jgi:hypothetical protein